MYNPTIQGKHWMEIGFYSTFERSFRPSADLGVCVSDGEASLIVIHWPFPIEVCDILRSFQTA